MNLNDLTPQQRDWLQKAPSYHYVQSQLMALPRRKPLTEIHAIAQLWYDVHPEVQPMTWDTYQSSVPPQRPQEKKEYSLEEALDIAQAPIHFLGPQETLQALRKELDGKHLVLYDILSDLQPHTGKELLEITMDGDYRKKLSNIRRILDAGEPFQNDVKSVYYLPKNEAKKEAVYQLKQRV